HALDLALDRGAELLEPHALHEVLHARLVTVLALAEAVLDADDRLAPDEQVLRRDEVADRLREERLSAEPAPGEHGEAAHAVALGKGGHRVHLGRRKHAPGDLDALHVARVVELVVEPVGEPDRTPLVGGELGPDVARRAVRVAREGGAMLLVRGAHVANDYGRPRFSKSTRARPVTVAPGLRAPRGQARRSRA